MQIKLILICYLQDFANVISGECVGRRSPKVQKISRIFKGNVLFLHFLHFFCQKICVCHKKAVLLHPLSEMKSELILFLESKRLRK